MSKQAVLRPYSLLIGLAVFVLALDQAAKALVLAYMGKSQAIVIIPGFFDLVNARNRGAAFGFLNRADIEWQFWLFLAATLVAVVAIIALARSSCGDKPLLAGLGLVLGGALGNLIDRIRFRAVIDYLDFYIGSWHWPAFNVADMGICIGVFIACIAAWRKPQQEKP